MKQNKISGAGGGGGKSEQPQAQRNAVISPDSLISRQFARVLDLVSEGEVEGLVDGNKSIYLDGTPLQNADDSNNFSGFTIDTRSGASGQTYISGFTASESASSVGVEVRNGTPVVRTISNPNANALRVAVGVPSLYYQNPSNGDVSGSSITLTIEVQPYLGSFAVVKTDTISGKCTSRYSRNYRIELTGASPWNVRITKTTANSDAQTRCDLFWDAYTEIIDAKLSYPNSALVGITIDSSQFASIPSRAYDMKGLRVKVPSNYDPVTRVYTGIWNGTFNVAWTDNPAWCFYDLLTNPRYGLGEFVTAAQVDKANLYTIGKYCDELVPDGFGGMEPRFACNLYLQTREEAFRVLSDMVSIFAGMLFWASGGLSCTQDAPDDAIYSFTNSNVIDGTFTYSGSSRNVRHTTALVSYNDPDDKFTRKVEYVEDLEGIAKWGLRQAETVAIGCTSRGQAHRLGKRILLSERYLTEVVNFKTGLEGTVPYPGAVIKVMDNARAGARMGGRIKSATTSTVTLDSPVVISAGVSYVLTIIMPDGTMEERGVVNVPGSQTALTVTVAFSVAPNSQSVWVLTSTELDAQLFKVVGIKEVDGVIYEVTALQYNPSKYAAIEQNLLFEPLATSLLDSATVQGPPRNPTITEELYRSSANTVDTKMIVTWDAPIDTKYLSHYKVFWRYTAGNWNVVPDEGSQTVSIYPVNAGGVEVKLVAVNALGKISEEVSVSATLAGKTTAPVAVTGITSSAAGSRIQIDWVDHPEIDVDSYEVRLNDLDWGVANSNRVYSGSSSSCYYVPTGSGDVTFYIRARDMVGNWSPTVSHVFTYAAIAAPGFLTAAFSDTALTAALVNLTWGEVGTVFGLKDYQITYGAETIYANASTIDLPADWLGSRMFSVKARDVNGALGVARSLAVTMLAPAAITGLRAQVIDNNVLLYWTMPATTSLPLSHVRLKRGATWATATDIGTKSGSFTTVFETQGGTFTYWAAAVDTEAHEGPPASVAVSVNQPPDYVFNGSLDSTLAGTLSSAKLSGGKVYLPVNTSETFAQHFSTRGWASPSAQQVAGYPVFIQPAAASGYYEEVFDFGSVFPATKATASVNGVAVAGSPVLTPTISLSLDGSSWTDYAGVSEVFGTNFRYVKFRLAVASGGVDLYELSGLTVRLDSKIKSDAGSVSALSTDASGTLANFNVEFVEVSSITVSAGGTTRISAVYDYKDSVLTGTYSVTSNVATLNITAHSLIVGQKVRLSFSSGTAPSGVYTVASVPNANSYTASITTANTSGNVSTYSQGLRIYLFDSAGARYSGPASWSVQGY